MKELLVLILIVAVAGLVYAFSIGHSHSVNFHYNCGVEIPWYDALFLDPGHCPGPGTQSRP